MVIFIYTVQEHWVDGFKGDMTSHLVAMTFGPLRKRPRQLVWDEAHGWRLALLNRPV